MPISIQHGSASMYAQAAQMIGESERIKTEQNIALQQQAIKARENLTERQNQLAIEAEMRSKEWELQKMTLASQNDFVQEERKRQYLADRELAKKIQREDELEAGLKAINESEYLSEEQKPIEALKYKMKKMYDYSILDKKQDDLGAILSGLGITAENITDLSKTGTKQEQPKKSWFKRWSEAVMESPSGMASFGGKFGGGINTGTNTPPVIQKAIQKLQLTEQDKQRLNNLDAESRASFETVFNSDNPELIQLALNRLRNL